MGTVTAQNTRLDDASAITDWVAIVKALAAETDFFYNGSACIANIKAATGIYGMYLADTVTSDISGAGTYNTVIFKVFTYAPGAMETLANDGMQTRIGSGTADYYDYTIFGNDTYPAKGGWQIVPIDPNVAAYRNSTTGTPGLTVADYYAFQADFVTVTKIGAIGCAAMDIGSGLTVTGTGSTFQDFIDFDEGTSTNRFGYVTTAGSVLNVVGMLTIGSATLTEFADSNKTINFSDGLFADGFSGTTVALGNASSTEDPENCTFIGSGRAAIIQDFHTNTDVDGTNEEIDIVGHGFLTGDYVDYSKQGGTDVMGLTDAGDYWVRAITDDAIAFYTTRPNAISDTTRVGLTASGGTETHRLTKLTDTRPDFIVSGTSGSASLDGNAYLNHRNVTYTSASSQDGGQIQAKLLTQNSADISNVTIVTSAAPSVACLQDPVFGATTDLHDVDFIQGSLGEVGHAFELSAIGATVTLTNITFTGYGADTTDQAAIDVTAASGTTTITVSGGDTPTYKTAGATVVLVSGAVTVEAFASLKDGTPVENARVFLKASDGTGPFPFEDAITSITRSTTTATVTTTAVHGMATNDKIYLQGITDKTEDNWTVHQITVTGPSTFTYTTTDSGSTNYTGTILVTFVALNGLTNASGILSASRVYTTDQPVVGWTRKSTSSPFLQEGVLVGTVDSSTGFAGTAVMLADE